LSEHGSSVLCLKALKSESPADIYRLFEQILWEGMMGI